MTIVKLSGGLGNQMFQYATGIAVASQNGLELQLDTTEYSHIWNTKDTLRTYDLPVFGITTPIATTDQIKNNKYPLGVLSKLSRFIRRKIFRNFILDYHPEIFSCTQPCLYLEGFFQSEKNFLGIRAKLLNIFTLQTQYKDAHVLKLEKIISDIQSISIHIRRGDYAQNSDTNKYHGLCPISYYETAMKFMSEKSPHPHFFIFSDDIAWVKENLQIPFQHTYVSGNDLIPAQEMYLMSKCKHNIIANSTFSWWGAWLNQNPDKIVIAPKKWTNKVPDPHPNIIPETWIRM